MKQCNVNCLLVVLSVVAGIAATVLSILGLLPNFTVAVWIALVFALFVLLVIQMANTCENRACCVFSKCIACYGKALVISSLLLVLLCSLFIAMGYIATEFVFLTAFVFIISVVFFFTVSTFFCFMGCIASPKNKNE